MTNCRYCEALDCDPEVHEAAANIHAYLRSLVNRNWAKDMAKAKAEAKKLWHDRRNDPNYQLPVQKRKTVTARDPERARIAGGRGGKAFAETRRFIDEVRLNEALKAPSHRDRAAYMRKYRKTHPEAK